MIRSKRVGKFGYMMYRATVIWNWSKEAVGAPILDWTCQVDKVLSRVCLTAVNYTYQLSIKCITVNDEG